MKFLEHLPEWEFSGPASQDEFKGYVELVAGTYPNSQHIDEIEQVLKAIGWADQLRSAYPESAQLLYHLSARSMAATTYRIARESATEEARE